MKVTVCFGSVRVVVPCGEGEFLVRDLMQKASLRYKKATAKPSGSWVTVHNLKQLDGGILDPDDRLQDVADDREQILAIYDEEQPHNQGDGTSASDDSQDHEPVFGQETEHKFSPFSRNDIEITGEALNSTPPPLHVRRGSEPALNRISPIPPASSPTDPCKRWSAAPLIDHNPPNSTPMKAEDGHTSNEDDSVFLGYPPGERGEGSGQEKNPSSSSSSASSHHSATTNTLSRFNRDGNRCSVQVLSDNPAMDRWADAADRALAASSNHNNNNNNNNNNAPPSIEYFRRDPLGGSASRSHHSRNPSYDQSGGNNEPELIVLKNNGEQLGIHVIPSTDRCGQDHGLLVEGIVAGKRIYKDGRIKVHDRIIEINNKPLYNIDFQKAQEIFKDAMHESELRLLVVKKGDLNQNKENIPHNGPPFNNNNNNGLGLIEGEERFVGGAKVANVASTRKAPSASLSSRTQAVILHSNTRKIGKCVTVNLIKGPHGLGFSITTRDNSLGGEAPIYIKNILTKGAAIEDGTLKIGDRLLEVNNVKVTGYSQSEVAMLLRQITIGGEAKLVVSRHEKSSEGSHTPSVSAEETIPSPQMPRQMVEKNDRDQLPSLQKSMEKAVEDSLIFPWKQREILTFEIPVHDSERAGLGVSVKGNKSNYPNAAVDLGIFVKNVIHGGAASRDGRLRQNDQLVNINGLSLLGKNNSEATATLRKAMHEEGPNPGKITLTVARRVDYLNDGHYTSGRDSANSVSTSSSNRDNFPSTKYSTPSPDHANASDALDAGMHVFKHPSQISRSDMGQKEAIEAHNPVIQRLTGNGAAALRNESYYKATHDTWNTSQLHQFVMRGEGQSNSNIAPPPHSRHPGLGSPTINQPSQDTLIIHDEYDPAQHKRQNDANNASCKKPGDPYASQSSLDESGAGFSRDQFGRQSMSEKRHATLDAKNTDTYQRNKKAREERDKQRQMIAQGQLLPGESARNRDLLSYNVTGAGRLVRTSSDDSLASHNHQLTNIPLPNKTTHDRLAHVTHGASRQRDFGPGLGMKKSSSLESLQTMVQEMALEEEGQRLGSGRVPRGRGCNESFRAAVDRSYDAPLSSNVPTHMETLAEEESESSGSGFGRGNSRQSSVNSAADDKLRKNSKKKPGLFKGLGSMFRFGKHRKNADTAGVTVDDKDVEEKRKQEMEKYRQMMNNSRGAQDILKYEDESTSQGLDDESSQSRSERMHQLRAEHQRRHAQRNRTYPTDDIEEKYEEALRQRLETVPPEPKSEPRKPPRPASYDVYGDGLNRPGSRTAYADPHKFSHYVNYEQIQQHLRKSKEQERLKKLASQQFQDFRDKQTSREQREYQSQRCARENRDYHRPVSNYFEYESVQAIMNHAQETNSTSLPRRPPLHNNHQSSNVSRTVIGANHPPSATNSNGEKSVVTIGHPNKPSSVYSSNPTPVQAPFKPSLSSHISNLRSGGNASGENRVSSHYVARDGVFAASGYRPASHYGTQGLRPPTPHLNNPPPPRSKV